MFTGIIEELGRVASLETRSDGARLRIHCGTVLEDAVTGCSIAVNGVCLTAVDLRAGSFSADLASETLRRTNLGDLAPGAVVNLERPLAAGGRLGGHIVQGHVDGKGEIVSLDPLGSGNWWLRVRVPPELDRYLVFKGSVAIDGISLTVAGIQAGVVSVALIPHTMENTNLKGRRAGSRVNLECDILAKYIEKLAGRIEAPSALTMERLKEEGY
jgi:riboflavin synthase